MATAAHIVCPLEFERRALARAGLEAIARLHRCGPGAAGVARVADLVGSEPTGPVILAGVAGGLDPRLAVGSAHAVTGVVDADRGTTLAPPIAGDGPACLVTSAAATVASAPAKQALAAATGAHLVDLESVAFAALADAQGWQWAIVRGVGDDADSALPAGIDRWVDESGRLRAGPLIADLCRDPRLVTMLRRLRRDGAEALDATAALIRRLIGPVPPADG